MFPMVGAHTPIKALRASAEPLCKRYWDERLGKERFSGIQKRLKTSQTGLGGGGGGGLGC